MGILIGIIGAVILAVLTIVFSQFDENKWYGTFYSATKVILVCVLIAWCLVFAIAISSYHSCEVTSKIINAQYGTEYTANDLFWAGNVIDKLIRTENDVKDNNSKIELDIK